MEKSSLNDILKKAEDENTVIYHGETRDVSKWMAKSRFLYILHIIQKVFQDQCYRL
ncbi:hypothetical protein I6H46_02185 [Anaerococcus obesiensis]|uniref:Uncharacterized protein n=1 Tax=Anaerococcus obesiensis TaxID=1287640 RepID=A0A7T7UUI8_9FIRM|nr:hypothetical protein [Anaerococcus obesiensis]QQN56448.1 hypothetical protein I6H46_02185 [Anaerococcus obesiensis]